MVTHSVKAASKVGRVLFIVKTEKLSTRYIKANRQMNSSIRISHATLTMLATGGRETMKSGLYLKLSVNGIKKNKKLYLPLSDHLYPVWGYDVLSDRLSCSESAVCQDQRWGYYADDPWIWFWCDLNLFSDPSVLHKFISDPQTTERVWVVSHP